jgi:hypothetical protein
MSADRIQASVGMYNHGTTNCYNRPADVATIVRLINLIAAEEGGTKSLPLPGSPSPRQLFNAIRQFQQIQNNLGHVPPLSIDGHVESRGCHAKPAK